MEFEVVALPKDTRALDGLPRMTFDGGQQKQQ
jgi:hypothetical protein